MTDSKSFDVLVAGGGPAGMAAAITASKYASRVGLIDSNPTPGGQIWRADTGGKTPESASRWLEQLGQSTVVLLSSTKIIDCPAAGVLHVISEEQPVTLNFSRLIIATGARERFIPFPGWTLPNVMGAGGLQALVKGGYPVSGKRVVIAGTGPLLIAVAAYLRAQGAHIEMIADQVPWGRWLKFGLGLLWYPDVLAQALTLKSKTLGIPYLTDAWITEAAGSDRLVSVELSHKGRLQTLACDILACGFHLVPNLELPMLLGCRIEHGRLILDVNQQSSVENVYGAGEVSGVGGVELSLVEGQIAAFAATDQKNLAMALMRKRSRRERFARRVEYTFALRDELRHLPTAHTRVCRCEDVDYGELTKHTSWRSAKLHTRCGMGMCQGRVCGAASEFLFGWKVTSSRPPLWPTSINALATLRHMEETDKN